MPERTRQELFQEPADGLNAAAPICPSCGARRQRRYCAECGEKSISPEDFKLSYFLFEHLPDEFLHVDGKLPKTIWLLLLQPGALAESYVTGRRQPFVGPLRVYIVLFLLHMVVDGTLSGPGSTWITRVHDSDPFGLLSYLMASRPNVDWHSPTIAAHFREVGHWLGELSTLFIFLLVAGVQKLIFYRLHRYYLEHVALALNVASFFLAALTICEVFGWAVTKHPFTNWQAQLESVVSVTALPIYWCLAIRRFYELKTLPSVAAAIVITFANAVMALALSTIVYVILIETV